MLSASVSRVCGCNTACGLRVALQQRCWPVGRCCSNVPTLSTAVTYFLGLVRTTQRYTRGVSWLFITSKSWLSIFQPLHRAVVGSNAAVRDINKPSEAGCKRKLVSWADCKFPVCSGSYFYLFGLRGRRVCRVLGWGTTRGPWHGSRQDGGRTACCVADPRLCQTAGVWVWRGNSSPTHRADVDCAADGFHGCSWENCVVVRDPQCWAGMSSKMWARGGRKCLSRVDERREKGEAPVRRCRSVSLPRCQVYVNHSTLQTYLSNGGVIIRSAPAPASEQNNDYVLLSRTYWVRWVNWPRTHSVTPISWCV